MRNLAQLFLLVIGLVAVGSAVAAQSTPEQQAAENEIRASAQAFMAAFNKGDATGVAALWTADAVYVNEDGDRFEGRKSIQREYETLFKNNPDVRLQVEIDSIRLINDVTAIEEGRAALSPQPPGAVRVMSRYTAVHVKQDGRWLMAEERDTRVELPPDTGQLQDLDWLVGSWVAASKDVQVEVNCRWIQDQQFLSRTHAVTDSGKAASGGLEIIGRDPSTGRITSWSFTNDGGHAVGIWAPHANGWMVESVGVMKDGTPTSATYILSRKDNETLLWKSGNRIMGGTLLPDGDEVTLKRK
jgi:uncharacterized protein (TIGR02246 family)